MTQWFKNFLSSEKGENFKNFVFGFQDGLISTYVLLIGIAGLIYFSPQILLVTLFAEIASGAISMAFGAYISTKTKNEFVNKSNSDLEGSERLELFCEEKGLNEEEKKDFKENYNKHSELWEKIIKIEEDSENSQDPIDNAMYMAAAFVLGGLLVVIPYLLPIPALSFLIATILSFSALFLVGVFRSFLSDKGWIKPALEMLLLGILAVIIILIYLFFISKMYGAFIMVGIS